MAEKTDNGPGPESLNFYVYLHDIKRGKWPSSSERRSTNSLKNVQLCTATILVSSMRVNVACMQWATSAEQAAYALLLAAMTSVNNKVNEAVTVTDLNLPRKDRSFWMYTFGEAETP